MTFIFYNVGPLRGSKSIFIYYLLKSQLIIISGTPYSKNTENQQQFFIELATQKGFEPENWDKITKEELIKQVRKMLRRVAE